MVVIIYPCSPYGSVVDPRGGYRGHVTPLGSVKTYLNYANPYMVLPLFATRFADYAGGIRVSFIQPRLF